MLYITIYTYLIYTDSPEIKQLLSIDINKPIKTVYDILLHGNSIQILSDPRILIATQEILPDPSKNKHTIQLEIKRKENAINELVKRYNNNKLSEDLIRQCLYSISDNNSFLNSNLRPILQCIELLKYYFNPGTGIAQNAPNSGTGRNSGQDFKNGHEMKIGPESPKISQNYDPNYDLSISAGNNGARLSHTHIMQYNYVLQSLTLWAAITEDMFRLWCVRI